MKSIKSTLKKIKGDASFRSFYRKKNNKKNSIIVYATKEKEKNLLIYDAINSLLIKNKILAPKLYKENYKQNFIEIEDFGDETVFKLLRKSGSNKINLYKKSIDLLIEIQKIKQNIIKTLKEKIIKSQFMRIINYLKKQNYFLTGMQKNIYLKKNYQRLNIEINKQIKFLLSNLKIKNETLVHRDFHVSNLMRHKKN